MAYYVLLAAGLLATVAVTVVVTRAARRALRRGTATGYSRYRLLSRLRDPGGKP